MGRIAIACIRLYQVALSPLLGANCRYSPTCSQYAIDAVRRQGLLCGTGYALWRVLRCNPFSPGGYDPAP